MKTALVYRFHKDVEVHVRRLEILRHFNPGVPIHGLYGGESYPQACQDLGHLLDSMYVFPHGDSKFKWMHAEFMLRDWFFAEGHKHAFDRLIDHEWDLLHTAPVAQVYAGVPPEAVAFGGLKSPIQAMVEGWWWVAAAEPRSAFAHYCRYAAMAYGIGLQAFICQGVGSVLSRDFLEKFAAEPLPLNVLHGVHCEISLPGYAQFLGFNIVDHALHPPWTGSLKSFFTGPMFHCNGEMHVDLAALKENARRSRGPRRTSFHPVPAPISLAEVLALPAPES